MARLVIHPGTPQARNVELKPGINHLGRAFANDFQIEDPSVSSSHCQIVVNDGAVAIKDLGSTNGTFVNRAPVQEAALRSGQTIHLGGVEMLFSADAPAADGPATAPPPIPRPIPIARALTTAKAPSPATALSANPPIAPPAIAVAAAAPAASSHGSTSTTVFVGVATCKFHPKAAARFMCDKCHKYFCDLCVTLRRTGDITHHLCRSCGSECVAVTATVKREKVKKLKQYSDLAILVRTVGFAFVAALISAAVWGGFTWLTGFDVTFIFSAATGFLCAQGVKIGSQDRPGVLFSSIAVFFCLLGIVLGKVAATVITGMLYTGVTKLATEVLGVMVGCWIAWWRSGGDL